MEIQTISADPELVKEFLEESRELLENLNNDLVDLESDPRNKALLDRIFRAVHTIKGTASFLGFDQLVELTHGAEDVLHIFRNGERIITPNAMDVILEAIDKIKVLVKQIRNNDIKNIDLIRILKRLDEIKSDERVEESEKENSENNDMQKIIRLDEMEKKTVARDLDSSTIRVDVERLDDLMNLVGELVLERNRLLQINREYRENPNMDGYTQKVAETTEKIHFVTTELQLSVLKTRMIPIDRLFRKFPRLVRDIAREMNKEVELVVSGGETELDKTVIDQLGDPLIHLLRNAIDHGIEPPDVRKKKGKPKVGKVQLSATQEGNHILINIRDDGKGIDTEIIKNKALEKELITSEQFDTISNQDVMQFIFEAGFSTIDKVSSISGRGVGMDVVRTNIRNLNGMIDLYSEPGVGTEIVLKLPLTLAIMQALMVQVVDDVYAIPLASVVETIRIEKNEIKNVNQKEVICHRDSVIPILRMQSLFPVKYRNIENKNGNGYVVLVGAGEKRFGLMANRLLGQEEVVIKSLGDYLGSVSGIAGGTITGDGRVRLIVDCANISKLI